MKLRIPLILLSLSIALYLSYYIGLIWDDSTQQLSYSLFLISFIFLFEKTKMSEQKVNKLVGLAIGGAAMFLGSLVETQDWSYLMNILI
ncbi:hypothetical protein PO903_01525 [Paenibacillus sp. PK4536]|uniref:Uncharacterized protein n=1 Tax=Paenibacillus nuruki TaxID=1886670 RepID=A0A1E3LA03_9BACL|nr:MULTISPECIES: hypothetical protein [Paenibacillus]ODP30421.1 hypothetical protein PTI45_00142 [Paenibacillus nuruki]WIM39599.1 hypothetical protein PO903_01525 [Paenibacillus sp. PK4536]